MNFRHLSGLGLFGILIFLTSLRAGAAQQEWSAPLTDGKWPAELIKEKSKDGTGGIELTKDGVELAAESRRYAFLKLRNEHVGTDEKPYSASVYIHQTVETDLKPALNLFWDRKNWINVQYTASRHLYVNWNVDGNSRSRGFWNVLPDPKKEGGVWLRVVLTSRNATVLLSSDGSGWRTMMDLGGRPGRDGAAFGSLIVGRGWNGEPADDKARLDFANDYYPEPNKKPIGCTIRDLRIVVGAEPLPPDLPDLEAKESWDATVDALNAAGVPRQWTMLGPRPDKKFGLYKRENLEPEKTDDWKEIPKDERGQPFRSTQWVRPEEDGGTYVDMAEILDPDNMVLAFARTEIEWPISGPAMLWTDSNGLATVFVNNRQVFEKTTRDRYWQHHGSQSDRFGVPVRLERGKNVIKVKTGQDSGNWGFYLRLERNDPGFRIRLLERLLTLFPQHRNDWRGAEARLEIARRYEQLYDFAGARAAYDRALKESEKDDEYRVLALGGKLRLLERLRDWPEMLATADANLKAFPAAPGSEESLQACLLAECQLGKLADAQKRADAAIAAAGRDGDQLERILRALAGAAEGAGKRESQWAALERLAGLEAVEPEARARAGFEAAFGRLGVEHWRVTNVGKIEEAPLKEACAAAQKALALLPGASNPQAQLYAKEADQDQKAGKWERAALGYWAAALHAWCAGDAEYAKYLALNKAYTLPSTSQDPATKQPRAFAAALKELESQLGPAVGDVAWQGSWQAIGPFDNPDGSAEREELGPETNADLKAKYKGRGGQKGWVELKSDQHWTELGQDLRKLLGDCKNGVVVAAREFEVKEARKATLTIAAREGWYAYIDGQRVAERPENYYRLDKDRIEVALKPGKHRLSVKLISPEDDGEFPLRAGFCDEPMVATALLRYSWLLRDFGAVRNLYDAWDGLWWWSRFTHWKTGPQATARMSDSLGMLWPAHTGIRWEIGYWTGDRLREYGMHGEAADFWRGFLQRLELGADFPERDAQMWATAQRLFGALMADGETESADALLQHALAMYPPSGSGVPQALIARGVLRQNFSLSRESEPLFRRALREYPWDDHVERFASGGLSYASDYRPERLSFDTRHEIQNAIEAAQRQMQAGGAEDVERALRNLGDVVRAGSEALIRVRDDRFTPLYVGVREYIRALLQHLGPDTLAVYRKVVQRASEQAYAQAFSDGDPAMLESLAGTYYYTPVAARALNRAGNLYLDRGAYGQAAAVFRILLREYREEPETPAPLVAAKFARTLMLDGNIAAARKAIDSLEQDFGTATLTVGGKEVAVKAYAQELRKQAAQQGEGADDGRFEAAATLGGSMRRTGAPVTAPHPEPGGLAWAHPLLGSESADVARTRFYPDPYLHLPSHPVAADGRVFVSSPEWLFAYDLEKGRELWSAAWNSTGRLQARGFSGHPVSCPTVHQDKVYLRVQSGKQSALRCYNAQNGKMRWSTASVPELNRAIWLSDPLIAYGLALAVFMEGNDMNTHGVAALDAETGRFRWRRNLVTGSTGLKIGDEYFGSSMQLGPPAADGGVVYTATGCNTVAALNAFTGELVWMVGYPRLEVRSFDYGNVDYTRDMPAQYLKLMARGASAPVLGEEVVVLAPKDGSGLFALERRGGAVRWSQPLRNARFMVGACENRLLVADRTVAAIDMDSGSTVWSHDLTPESLVGRPGYSGGVLYLPTDLGLRQLDARTGAPLSRYAWDPRIGPLANLTVTAQRIVGVSEDDIGALGPPGTPPVALPLKEARALAAEGKHEAAAERFGVALTQEQGQALAALSGRLAALASLGRQDEALADLDKILATQPEMLRAPGGQWEVRKPILSASIRTRLGQPPEAPAAPALPPAGLLTYAWQIEGRNPDLLTAPDMEKDRLYVLSDNEILALRISAERELLWRGYAGVDVDHVAVGPRVLVARGPRELRVLDRLSGEPLGVVRLPTDKRRRRGRANADRFGQIAVNDKYIAFAAGDGIFVYDLATLKEVWAHEMRDRSNVLLRFTEDKLVELRVHRREELNCFIWDAPSGRRLTTSRIDKPPHWNQIRVSEDGKVAVYRHGYNALFGVDLVAGKKLWGTRVDRLDASGYADLGLDISGNTVIYHGNERDGKNRGWRRMTFDLMTGKLIDDLAGGQIKYDDGWLVFQGDWSKLITRLDGAPGAKETKEVWRIELRPEDAQNHHLRSAQRWQGMLYLLYTRSGWGASERFVLRTYDWETGQMLDDRDLPVTPLRHPQGQGWIGEVRAVWPLFLIGGQEGLFAFAPNEKTRPAAAARLQAALQDGKLPPATHRETRRALAELAPLTLEAFLAPSGAKADGDLSEWSGSEPLSLADPAQALSLGDAAAWKGADDLSAKVYAGWNEEGIFLAVDVRDDKFQPPLSGAELASADSLRIGLNGLSEPRYGYDRSEDLVCSMALVDGRTVIDTVTRSQEENPVSVTGRVNRAPDGKGLRYELLLPWPLIRRDARKRPGRENEIYLGLAVLDDDGEGVETAVEWGAGVTSPQLILPRLGRLSLLDISTEKVERYRKVIAKIPDAPESLQYLELILRSKRGLKAYGERKIELENFVKAHPESTNTIRALSWLEDANRRLGAAEPRQATVAFAKTAKVPEQTIDALAGRALRLWVYPDPKQPPQMLMLQFFPVGQNWNRRAYWGENKVGWGREGSVESRRMGDLPPPGQWTQLEVRAMDLELDGLDLAAMAFTSFGGQCHWDRVSVTVAGKEQVLIEDALPDKFPLEGNALKLESAPVKSGQKSWSAGANKGLLNSHLNEPGWKTWFSFKDPNAAAAKAPDHEAYRKLYREVADLVPDSPESWTFLRRILNTYQGDQAVRDSIRELEDFLRRHPGTPNALAIFDYLRELYTRDGTANTTLRCEDLMTTLKLSRDVQRAFYTKNAPCWTRWQVIGPFQALGERRGLDQVMDPERNVDLNWKVEGPYAKELTWQALKNESDPKKGKSQWMDVGEALLEPFEKDQRRDLERAPYFAYAYRKFNVPTERSALLFFGVNDGISIWVNGRRVVAERFPGNEKDQGIAQVTLRNGENEILIKAGIPQGKLRFCFRIADASGKPFADLPNE
ncbi:MAG: PQQ-binding-like beta-propeller repeat protein [Planctomycetes bacterium]|nr:PQQ-binding-like beta-propeller repeat protein [Planctomycetota bacterium]